MRIKITIAIGLVFTGLLLSVFVLTNKLKQVNKQLSNSINNEKAYAAENSKIKNDNIIFKMTAQQLSHSKDSLFNIIDSIRIKNKIKQNRVQSISYIKSIITKHDSIYLTDTVFSKNVSVDTTLSDKWYKLQIALKYPNKVYCQPTFISEKTIFVTEHKETVDPPKKFFLLRWFQKKQKVATVDVIEGSPYISTSKQRFIEIIK